MGCGMSAEGKAALEQEERKRAEEARLAALVEEKKRLEAPPPNAPRFDPMTPESSIRSRASKTGVSLCQTSHKRNIFCDEASVTTL